MLGLKYGTVELTPYTEEWERAFLEERARLGEALSDIPCEIEHVGSKAVPGLCAKPIVDIAIGVPTGHHTSRSSSREDEENLRANVAMLRRETGWNLTA